MLLGGRRMEGVSVPAPRGKSYIEVHWPASREQYYQWQVEGDLAWQCNDRDRERSL
jgi:hypothetical protein